MNSKLVIGCLIFLSIVAEGQVYTIDNSIPLSFNDEPLMNPWAGGINAGQYNTMDMNADGREDLVVFDRTAAIIKVFLATDDGFVYDPLLALDFPEGITSWMLLRDFNCDGRKDIFTSDPLGIKVYVNESDAEGIKWRVFNDRSVQSPLLTKGFSDNPINLQMNSSDIPAIDDIDNDGDLDILVFRFSSEATIEFHKNLSIENTGVCDSIQLERVTQRWGDFQECNCGSFAFNNDPCPDIGGGRTEHQSGKSLLAIDMDGDGDKEIVIGEESCGFLSVLTNEGDANEADFNSFSNFFPSTTNPVSLNQFPAAYFEDVDADGIKDLIVAPNVPNNVGFGVNFRQSSWFYKNSGTNTNPNFNFIQNDFLQDQMLDLGENGAPAFYDYDNDGDLDMFVSSFLTDVFSFESTFLLFEDIGTQGAPVYNLLEDDLFSFSQSGLINFKPEFTDLDGDGLIDFVFTATSLQDGSTNLYFLERIQGGFDFNTSLRVAFGPIGINENIKVFDIDNDGEKDLLVGKSTGRVEYYKGVDAGTQFQFELEDESFFDLDFSPFRQFTAMDIADLNGDGLEDLIIGDSRGNITYFSDFLNNLDVPTQGETDLFRIDEGTIAPLSFGSRIRPIVTNLFNEDLPSIVFGTGQGGLVVVRNEGAIANPINGVVGVYPNPVAIDQLLTINSLESTRARVVNLLGQVVIDNLELVANEPFSLNVSGLKEGLYLLVPETDNESTIRFVVVR